MPTSASLHTTIIAPTLTAVADGMRSCGGRGPVSPMPLLHILQASSTAATQRSASAAPPAFNSSTRWGRPTCHMLVCCTTCTAGWMWHGDNLACVARPAEPQE
jgi:hypothetical protein